MAIARTVQHALEQSGISFDVIAHDPTPSSLRTADAAHLDPGAIAKAVLLTDDEDRGRHLMAVVPASCRVSMTEVSRRTGRPVHLATEDDAARVFPDCRLGAVPPLGPAYGVETVWDDRLMTRSDVYFEAGDHEHLVHVKTWDFVRLLPSAAHGRISAAK